MLQHQHDQCLVITITKDIATVLNYGDESVSVALEEVTPAEWGEKVYRPDIVDKAATLYKKPGYTMQAWRGRGKKESNYARSSSLRSARRAH
jgi:4-oxalocrotonate tautomerase